MAMDMNPFPTGYGNQLPTPNQAAASDPSKPPQVMSPTAGVLSMIQALSQGYGKYQRQHPNQPPGPPLPITPQIAPAWPPAGSGAPPMPLPNPMTPTSGVPFAGNGPMGTGTDPMTQALFSPPPASPWGGGSDNAVY